MKNPKLIRLPNKFCGRHICIAEQEKIYELKTITEKQIPHQICHISTPDINCTIGQKINKKLTKKYTMILAI